MAVAINEITDLDVAPDLFRSEGKCLRACFGGTDRLVVFSGIKKSITTADRWIGLVPHVGKLVEIGMYTAREGLGAGGRARGATRVWAAIRGGSVEYRDLEVIGRWPSHADDVEPINRCAIHGGPAPGQWQVALRTRKRQNWFELEMTCGKRAWMLRWENDSEQLTCSTIREQPDDSSRGDTVPWRKSGEKGPGQLLSRTWWIADVNLADGLHVELVAAMTREFAAEPRDFSLRVNGHEVFARGATPPVALAPVPSQ
jgi:hypothetical protein